MIHIAEFTHTTIDHTKHSIETIIQILESKERISHIFEQTGGEFTHEHRVIHIGELIFSRVMMMTGI